jgi:hypothetical protein
MVESPAQSGRMRTLIHPGPILGDHAKLSARHLGAPLPLAAELTRRLLHEQPFHGSCQHDLASLVPMFPTWTRKPGQCSCVIPALPGRRSLFYPELMYIAFQQHHGVSQRAALFILLWLSRNTHQ